MAIPTVFTDLSTTAAANSPAGTDSPTDGDNNIRAAFSFIASIYANSGNGWTSPYGILASANTWTGAQTAYSFIPSSATVPANGVYLPAANTVGIASNTTLRWSVNSTGAHTIAAPTAGDALTINAVSGDRMLLAESSLSGQGAIIKLSNTSNTASSDAVMLLSSGGGSAGDAYLRFDVSGVTSYVLGIDNSDSDKLVISRTQTVGTSNVLEITTNGNVSIDAPSSGIALTATAVAGALAADFPSGPVRTQSTTVASLLAAATAGAGARAFVTDANSTTFAAAAVGGGANKVPVYCDGAGWFIG